MAYLNQNELTMIVRNWVLWNHSFQCSFITSSKLLTVHWDIISSKAKHSMYTLIKMQTTNLVSFNKKIMIPHYMYSK